MLLTPLSVDRNGRTHTSKLHPQTMLILLEMVYSGSMALNISIQGIKKLAQGCTNLRTFIAKGRSSFIDNECVIHLATYCPNLEVVNLNGAVVSLVSRGAVPPVNIPSESIF